MGIDDAYTTLRNKLNTLGYNQPLSWDSVCLVGALFEDLVKTTESLRDAKHQIGTLLEEKACWELGVEPYKCDNSRLLAECNTLHLELIKQREDFDKQLTGLSKTLRLLESDKRHLEEHCAELEYRNKQLVSKHADPKSLKTSKDGTNMKKKPFVTAVKSGAIIPNLQEEIADNLRNQKCSCVNQNKHFENEMKDKKHLENELKLIRDELVLCQRRIESRDREIRRLHEKFVGGRPSAALAKDCCYKDVESIKEEMQCVQIENEQVRQQLHETKDAMHEAMNRAIHLEEKNRKLDKRLKELENTALHFEKTANVDANEKETEIKRLKQNIHDLTECLRQKDKSSGHFKSEKIQTSHRIVDTEKMCRKMNKLLTREKDLVAEISRITKENHKLEGMLSAVREEMDKISRERSRPSYMNAEEFIKMKTQRDFFQNEYLNLVENTARRKGTDDYKSQLADKDREINRLKAQLTDSMQYKNYGEQYINSPSTSAAVQATIQRFQRERDVLKSSLELTKNECEALHRKLDCVDSMHTSDRQTLLRDIKEKSENICKLECEIRELKNSQLPGQISYNRMQEEVQELRDQLQQLQTEKNEFMISYNRLKILQNQTEKALVDHQNKLTMTESDLENALVRLDALGTNRDTAREETTLLKNEISALNCRINDLENEKDNLMCDLDGKAEKIYQLENELRKLDRTKRELETARSSLKTQLDHIKNESNERNIEFEDTSIEVEHLRKEINKLKITQQQTMIENNRMIKELSESNADVSRIKTKLKESQIEVDRLKLKLQQYVQEVHKAEDLLLKKEEEREEILQHYRSLTYNTVLLEGNNQSLESEAAETKRQLCETEEELKRLKLELWEKDENLDKYQRQVAELSEQISKLECKVERLTEDKNFTEADLCAMKDVRNKLDMQRDKLNAELEECANVRKQLERENENLRMELLNVRAEDKAATESLNSLLASCRQDLHNHQKISRNLNHEINKLKERIYELQDKLKAAEERASRNEALAKEYNIQVEELQHDITNDRFQLARNRQENTSVRSQNLRKNQENYKSKIPSIYNNKGTVPKKISSKKLTNSDRRLEQKKYNSKAFEDNHQGKCDNIEINQHGNKNERANVAIKTENCGNLGKIVEVFAQEYQNGSEFELQHNQKMTVFVPYEKSKSDSEDQKFNLKKNKMHPQTRNKSRSFGELDNLCPSNNTGTIKKGNMDVTFSVMSLEELRKKYDYNTISFQRTNDQENTLEEKINLHVEYSEVELLNNKNVMVKSSSKNSLENQISSEQNQIKINSSETFQDWLEKSGDFDGNTNFDTISSSSFNGCESMREQYIELKKMIIQQRYNSWYSRKKLLYYSLHGTLTNRK